MTNDELGYPMAPGAISFPPNIQPTMFRVKERPHHPATKLEITHIYGHRVRIKWRHHMAAVSMDFTQQFSVTVAAVTATGAPGADKGPVTWPMDNPSLLTLVPSPTDPDTTTFQGIAGQTGTVNITPTDVSSNGTTITGPVIAVTITAPPLAPATQLTEVISNPVPM